jgi:hypothetical protein
MKKIPVETYSRVVGYFRPLNQWNFERNKLSKKNKKSIDKIKNIIKCSNRGKKWKK